MMKSRSIAALAAASAILTAGASAQASAIAYWDFDSATGSTVTDVVNGINGTMSGGAVLTADGGGHSGSGSDKALQLTGNNAAQDKMTVTAAQLTPYNPGTNSFSVSFWVRTNVRSGGFIDHAATNGYDIGLDGAGKFNVVLGSGGTGGIGWNDLKTVNASPSTSGVWEHVALVVDRDNGKYWLYLNGVAETEYTAAFDNAPAWLPNEIPGTVGSISFVSDLVIGARNNNSSFEGYIDDYAIYNVALTSAQVGALANRSATPLTVSNIPEPASIALIGLGGVLVLRRTRRA